MYKQHRLYIFFFLYLFCGGSYLFAQSTIYPVQLNVQLLPPFTPCLSDYVNEDYSRLRVIALQRDLTSSPNYMFALRLTIKKDNSIYLQSEVSQIYNNHGEFKVQPGIATIISGSQLRNIFNGPMHSAPRDYETNGLCLPEGYYEIIFQAFDSKDTRVPLSEAASTFVYFQKGKSPYLLSPADGSCVRYEMPIINFSWADETANFRKNRRYKIEIYEITDSVSYQSITTRQQPIIAAENLTMPFYTMPVTAGTLQKGKRYAWRVQSQNFFQSEQYNRAALSNDGYSEIYFFDYGSCVNPFSDILGQSRVPEKQIERTKIPELVRIDTTNFSAHAVWKNEEQYDYFVVEYRKKDSSRDWVGAQKLTLTDTLLDSLQLNGLTREVTYEVRVQGHLAGNKYSQYSNVLEFKLSRENKPANCGKAIPPLSSNVEISELLEGDVINANGYEVTITRIVRNGDGTFSGFGKTDAPIFKAIPLQVEFKSIRVNDAYELMQGAIVTVYDKATSATLDANGVLNKGATGSQLKEQRAIIAEVSNFNNLENYEGAIINCNGIIYAVENGDTTRVGRVNNAIDVEKGSRSAYLGEVRFSLIEAQNMLLDKEAGAFAHKGLINDHYETLKNDYKVPCTLVPSGQMRKLTATAIGVENPEDIKFVCGNIELQHEYHGNGSFTVSVFGGDDHSQQGVYATIQEKENTRNYSTIGKINLAHYSEKVLDVVIVPVNRDLQAASLQEELNAIYNPVGITVRLRIDSTFSINSEEYDFLDNGLQVDESGVWTNETEEMKQLKFLYQQERVIEPQTAYLFVLEKAELAGVAGDMPRGKQVGYIFGNNLNARLVAHELGHGAFSLEHTFATYGIKEGSTNNLMDYSEGVFLTCWQWGLVHAPRIVWNFLEGDEEGRGLFPWSDDSNRIVEIIKSIKRTQNGEYAKINAGQSYIKGYNIKLNNYDYDYIDVRAKYSIDSVKKISITKGSYIPPNDVKIISYNIMIDGVLTIGLKKEADRDSLFNYIVDDNNAEIDRIQFALDSISKYIGVVKYKPQYGSLKTDTTAVALEYMDCTELAARFVQLACGLEKVPSFSTAMLEPYAISGGMYGEYLQFIDGSDDENFTDMRPGDIFLWRNSTSGHVGVVESYSEPYVYILEALTSGCESSLNQGTCTYCVRRSKYTRTGKALIKHGDGKDWKGYFRPVINNK